MHDVIEPEAAPSDLDAELFVELSARSLCDRLTAIDMPSRDAEPSVLVARVRSPEKQDGVADRDEDVDSGDQAKVIGHVGKLQTRSDVRCEPPRRIGSPTGRCRTGATGPSCLRIASRPWKEAAEGRVPLACQLRSGSGSTILRMAGVLLCSAGLGALGSWLDEHVGSSRSVVFVDAAARPLPSASFVDDCKRALTDLGCELVALDLTTAVPEETAVALSRSTVVFVTGGYPIFLLQSARRSGFLDQARLAVQSGALSYIGVSAGAALAGPSVEPLAAEDDPGAVTDYRALGLVDFVVLPHANRYPPEVFESRRDEWAGRFPVRLLTDDRAVSVAHGAVVEIESA
jgi:dipeptidase E